MSEPDPESTPSSRVTHTSATLAWLGCALVPPIAFRIVVLGELATARPGLDSRGFVSDLAAGLLVAALVMAVAPHTRAMAVALVALWLAVCFGNAEHVLVNGSNATAAHVGYLTDTTFVLGSLLQPTLPVALAVIALATTLLCLRAARTEQSGLAVRRTAGAGGMLALALSVWPIAVASPEWRQAGPLESNLRPGSVATGISLQDHGAPRADTGRREPPDLSGAPILSLAGGRPNVLIVMVEGLSGAHVPSIAAANEVSSDLALPRLDALARRHIAYTSFVTQQRQTNRGEYAVLCGDWPKLRTGVPRMSEVVANGGPRCLPQAMADLGYETVYLQAAPLGFMMKDQFMTRIGFAAVLGNDWFSAARSRTNWGVDDQTFFEGALEEIVRLESAERPWMMTLLTVGTHHPYNVPDDHDSAGATGFARAALYADAALGAFVDGLARAGLLDHTLVLITTDESRGLPDGVPGEPVSLLLSRSWGLLVALVPGARTMQIDAPFLQSDLALSVLDYVTSGKPAQADAGGRSVFRHYEDGRRIAFGNTYQQRVVAVDPTGAIDVCREDFSVCTRFAGRPDRPFAAGIAAERDLAADEREQLATWLFGAAPASDAQPRIEMALLGDPVVPVLVGDARFQLVFGGQGLSAQAGARVDVDLDVMLKGGSGHVTFRTNLLASGADAPLHVDVVRLEPGERFALRYALRTASALRNLESRFVVIDRAGDALRLEFVRASIRVTEGAAPRLSSHALEVERREIVSPEARGPETGG